MFVPDSSVWLEVLTEGPLASRCAPYIADLAAVVTPALVMLEVYRILRRRDQDEPAMRAVGEMEYTRIVPADTLVAIMAAELSLDHGLAAADAIIYATARLEKCELVTLDADFRGLSGVTLIEDGS